MRRGRDKQTDRKERNSDINFKKSENHSLFRCPTEQKIWAENQGKRILFQKFAHTIIHLFKEKY